MDALVIVLPAGFRRSGLDRFSDVRRQLLGGAGDGSGDHALGHHPATTPLYDELARHGLLDASIPALIP